MKKIFFHRLIALSFLCLSSLLIKSENSVCSLRCACISKPTESPKNFINETSNNRLYHDDGFIIKI
jgi:hypothetical protein